MTTATTSSLTREDLETLRSITARWATATLEENWGLIASMCTEDMTFMPPGEPAVHGRGALESWYQSYPTVVAYHGAFLEGEGSEETACGSGTFALTTESDAGEPVIMSGKWLASYRKQPDGSWLVTRNCWNLDHPID